MTDVTRHGVGCLFAFVILQCLIVEEPTNANIFQFPNTWNAFPPMYQDYNSFAPLSPQLPSARAPAPTSAPVQAHPHAQAPIPAQAPTRTLTPRPVQISPNMWNAFPPMYQDYNSFAPPSPQLPSARVPAPTAAPVQAHPHVQAPIPAQAPTRTLTPRPVQISPNMWNAFPPMYQDYNSFAPPSPQLPSARVPAPTAAPVQAHPHVQAPIPAQAPTRTLTPRPVQISPNMWNAFPPMYQDYFAPPSPQLPSARVPAPTAAPVQAHPHAQAPIPAQASTPTLAPAPTRTLTLRPVQISPAPTTASNMFVPGTHGYVNVSTLEPPDIEPTDPTDPPEHPAIIQTRTSPSVVVTSPPNYAPRVHVPLFEHRHPADLNFPGAFNNPSNANWLEQSLKPLLKLPHISPQHNNHDPYQFIRHHLDNLFPGIFNQSHPHIRGSGMGNKPTPQQINSPYVPHAIRPTEPQLTLSLKTPPFTKSRAPDFFKILQSETFIDPAHAPPITNKNNNSSNNNINPVSNVHVTQRPDVTTTLSMEDYLEQLGDLPFDPIAVLGQLGQGPGTYLDNNLLSLFPFIPDIPFEAHNSSDPQTMFMDPLFDFSTYAIDQQTSLTRQHTLAERDPRRNYHSAQTPSFIWNHPRVYHLPRPKAATPAQHYQMSIPVWNPDYIWRSNARARQSNAPSLLHRRPPHGRESARIISLLTNMQGQPVPNHRPLTYNVP